MRLLAALAVLAVVLYATLPWWLPTARLKRWLEAQLTRQIGSAVAVGELTVSWREGVRIDSLTVANPAGFGSEALLTVPHIGMDFSPLRLAIHKRVKWMVVHSPHLRVAVDQTGRVNIQQLSMPDFDVTTTQISVRQAVAELSLPGRPEPLRLEAVGVEVRGDPWGQFAVVTMSAGLVQPSGSAPISMEAVRTGPAANRSEGMLELSFSNVDLEALDPISMGKLPLRRVAGTCSGRLRLPVRQGGVRSGQLDIEVLGLGLEPLSKPMMTAIDRIGLHIKVDVDPATNMVTASSLEVDADGIKLAGSARFHTSLLRRQWLAMESMRLVGKIDPRYIRPVTAGNGAAMAGEVAVDVAYDRSQEQLHATVQLDATAASMSIDGREVKPAGQPLRLATKASGEIGSQQFVFDTTELQLGDNRLIAHGVLVNVGDVLARWAEGTRAVVEGEVRSELAATDWSAQLDIRDLDSLRRLHPALAGVLANVKLAGSITGSCRLDHREQTRVGVNLVCGPGSRLQVGDWLDTPATESIEADINWLSDGQAGVSIVETQVAMR
ncbi:MAG: hypothetical protein HQ546_08525, partial [Planctomycetes bacterium]|nr:hypothetical protein [Planctomycetota bacterium]